MGSFATISSRFLNIMEAPQGLNTEPDQFPYSESGIRVMTYAQEKAKEFESRYVEPAHLFLGLAQEDNIKKLFEDLHIDRESFFESVELYAKGSYRSPGRGKLELNPRAKLVIKLAYKETTIADIPQIRDLDILIGLVREGGIEAKALSLRGLNYQTIMNYLAK